jgi:hypothetical protein
MLEELITGFVDHGSRGVALEVSCTGNFAGEVVACVEEFEEAAYSVEIFIYEIDPALLFTLVVPPSTSREKAYGNTIVKLRTRIRKPRASSQKTLMSRQQRLLISLAN